MKLTVPASARRVLDPVIREAARRGLRLFVVGGCVRDWLRRTQTKDFDLLLEAATGPIERFCAKRWRIKPEAFDRFGTIRLVVKDLRIDLVRARSESYSSPAALPDTKPGTLQDDLARRDFTVNAMAAELLAGGRAEVVDPHGGEADLGAGLLRVLHGGSFKDDPTRMYRAARYMSRLKLQMEAETQNQLQEAVSKGYHRLLSRERLRNELLRVLEEEDPVAPLKTLASWGLGDVLHPRFSWPAELSCGRGALERLGLMAARMGPDDGAVLLKSLHLERPGGPALLQALELMERRACVVSPLPPLASAVLKRVLKDAGPAALKPLLLGGADLQRLGLKPGPDYGRWLDRAARAQWAGEFSDRGGALRWLKRLVRPR